MPSFEKETGQITLERREEHKILSRIAEQMEFSSSHLRYIQACTQAYFRYNYGKPLDPTCFWLMILG